MAIWDYKTAVYQQLVLGMKGDVDFYDATSVAATPPYNRVRPDNFLDLTSPTSASGYVPFLFQNIFLKGNGSMSLFPRAALYQGESLDYMDFAALKNQGGTPTFASAEDNNPDWRQPVKLAYTLSLVFDSMRLDVSNKVCVAAIRGLKSLGPTLGIVYKGERPFQFGVVTTGVLRPLVPQTDGLGMPDGPVRSRCDIRIPVAAEFDGPALKALLP